MGSQRYNMGYQFNFKGVDNRPFTVLLRKSMPSRPAFLRTSCGDLLYIAHPGASTGDGLNKLMHELYDRINKNCEPGLVARQFDLKSGPP